MLLLILLLSLLTVSTAAGQELAVVHYGIREGLPSAYITCLAQGPDGRLWIGHSLGVSRYDGREFRTWTPDQGLLKVSPSSVLATDDGRIWVAFPQQGLQFIDRDGAVHTVPDPARILVRDHAAFLYRLGDDSVLLAGHKGYYRVAPDSVSGPIYPLADHSGYVTTILEGAAGQARLFATEDGVFRLREGRFERLPLPYDQMGSNHVSVMAFGPGGELWTLDGEGVLLRWNSEKDYTIWHIRQNDRRLYPYRILVDSEGTVWVACGQGLLRFRDGRLKVFSEDAGLSNSFIIDLLIDRDGVFWMATESGLDKISSFAFRNLRHERNLPVNSVWTIEEVPNGDIWLGTNSGIVVVDPNWHTRLWTVEDGLPEESVVHIKAAPDGDVWVLGYSGLYRWNGRRFIRYPQKLLADLNLYEVLPLSDREVWICTSGGVYRLDPRTNRLERHPLNDQIDGSKMISRTIRSRARGVWLLGPELYHWQPSGELHKVEFPPEWKVTSVRNLREDETGRLMILTDRGLAVLENGAWKLHRGPSGKQLFDLVETSDGDVWLGCNGGIARFDGNRFHDYSYYDGVALSECNTGAALQDSRGVIWLGGVDVSLVFPGLMRPPPQAIPIVTRVSVDGQERNLRDTLEVLSSVRRLDIRFAAPSFWNEQEQSFRYRLEGLETQWSVPGGEAFARYAGLSPGDYRFALQCRPKNGEWKSVATPLRIVVEPTWWQTVYAQMLLVVGLIVCGFFIGYVRIRRLTAYQSKLQRLVDEQTEEIKKQRDLMALQATTDELTGLPNRRKCTESLQSELARSRRSGLSFSVFLFDIDFFKTINDTNGHAAGDEVLHLIARVGRRAVRETDTLGRWGGDEFILLMPETDREQALVVCRRLKASIEREGVTSRNGITIKITISGGIATHTMDISPEPPSGGQIVRAADEALYRAKQSGRSRIIPASV